MALKTDYKDDILDSSVNVNRTFSIIDNTTGQTIYPNVSLEETTVFSQEGDSHTSQITNEQNTEINQLNADLTELSEKVGGGMKCAKFGIISGATGTVDISDLNLASAEDYMVILDGIAGYRATAGYIEAMRITNKTATSFSYATNANAASVQVSYQIITFR